MASRSMRAGGTALGILLFSAGVLLFAVSDALGTWLVTSYSSQEILVFRALGAATILVPLAWRDRASFWPKEQLGLNLLRVVCMTGDSFSFYLSTRYLPLADVMTFYLAGPLIITALSAMLLGERVDGFRWTAVLAGFVGVVIAVKPTGASFSPAAVLALGGASFFAVAITTTRRLRDTPWVTLIARQFAGAAVLGGLASPIGWSTPTGVDLVLLVALGILSVGCFVCITKALTVADASVIAPFQYSSIVWAALLGWLIWGDRLDGPTVVGVLIIVGSGLAVWWRELARSEPVAVDAVPVP